MGGGGDTHSLSAAKKTKKSKQILELDRGAGIPFEGNYSEWLDAKAKRLAAEERKQGALQKSVDAELDFMRRQAKGQQKKGAARARRYEDLVEAAAEYVKAAAVESITIPVGPRLGSKVLEVDGLRKAFGDRLLLEGLSFSLPPGAICGVIGGNGAGKSTLFRMIMVGVCVCFCVCVCGLIVLRVWRGIKQTNTTNNQHKQTNQQGEDAPDAGKLELGETVVPMYVDQSRGSLDADATVYEAATGGAEEIDLGGRRVNGRAYCGWYNFKSADQQKKVGVLSGGERNRLHLARVLRQAGNLLLLDEPTNDLGAWPVDGLRTTMTLGTRANAGHHLLTRSHITSSSSKTKKDVDTLRCLEDAVLGFAGSALVISHDRAFLDRCATHILVQRSAGLFFSAFAALWCCVCVCVRVCVCVLLSRGEARL